MFINYETSVELIAATKQVCNECLIRMKGFCLLMSTGECIWHLGGVEG